jgi:hypothetical protein
MGNGGIAPPLLISALDEGKWSASFTAWSLYLQEKNPWYPFNRRLCGPQSQSGHCRVEKLDVNNLNENMKEY